ncbi:hypothetical protein ABW636_06475 [Aquimarina sp. 2201CG1-2-11]|uniref:hypothetical protein n=1 Tax=Aquimarina discodermiae TaxID=3231043 RepID=UPI00346319C2
MKTLVTIVVHLIMGLLVACAQTTSSKSTTSSTKTTVKTCGETNKENYYRSFTVVNNDENYKIKVKFMENMQNEVKSFLIEQFGQEKMITNTTSYIWKKEIDDSKMYMVELNENQLRMSIDKELASDKLLKKFMYIGKELKLLTAKKI